MKGMQFVPLRILTLILALSIFIGTVSAILIPVSCSGGINIDPTDTTGGISVIDAANGDTLVKNLGLNSPLDLWNSAAFLAKGDCARACSCDPSPAGDGCYNCHRGKLGEAGARNFCHDWCNNNRRTACNWNVDSVNKCNGAVNGA